MKQLSLLGRRRRAPVDEVRAGGGGEAVDAAVPGNWSRLEVVVAAERPVSGPCWRLL